MGIYLFNDREGDGRPRIDSAGGEAVCLQQPTVAIALDSGPLQQPGTLYVTTKRLVWLSDSDSYGYAVDFLSLAVHAVSRDPEAYPTPCIYTQIETDDGYEDKHELCSTNGDSCDLSKVQELRLVPSDAGVLDNLFKALCECALMNPDPGGFSGEEGEWFFGEEELQMDSLGCTNGSIEHHVSSFSELAINDERFDDADELEEDNPAQQHSG